MTFPAFNFKGKIDCRQCDQIWQNFATLANKSKYSIIRVRVYLVFGKYLRCWTYFHCSKLPNIEQILSPSGHTNRRPQITLLTSTYF